MERLLESGNEEVFGNASGDGMGVFLHEGATVLTIHFAEAGVVAELHAVVGLAVIHDVGFEENGGRFIEAVGEEVAGVYGANGIDV